MQRSISAALMESLSERFEACSKPVSMLAPKDDVLQIAGDPYPIQAWLADDF